MIKFTQPRYFSIFLDSRGPLLNADVPTLVAIIIASVIIATILCVIIRMICRVRFVCVKSSNRYSKSNGDASQSLPEMGKSQKES